MKVLFVCRYAALLLAMCAAGDQLGTFSLPRMTRYRVEGNLLLNWKAIQSSSTDEIQIYDLSGKLLTHFGVLGLVPEAKRVGIHDVSARRGKMVAVSAEYVKPSGGVQSSLLLFGFDGKLHSAFALAPMREIALLALDDNLNIWTLTLGAGGQSPSVVPMIVEYDSSGREVRKLLTRDTFLMHAQLVRSTPTTGHPSMGYDSGTIWFWLPGTTDLVTVNADTGEVTRTTTGIPNLPDGVVPSTVFRLSANQYVLSTRTHNVPPSVDKSDMLESWSPESRTWSAAAVPADCGDGAVLLGVSDQKPVFVGRVSQLVCTGELK